MDELIRYLKMTQKELKMVLFEQLKEKGMNPISDNGFLYAEGEIPVLLVAHMDTVDTSNKRKPPKSIFYYQPSDQLYNPYDGILGGDDRCGVYAIIKLLERYRPYVLFTEDEEIGCKGAAAASKKIPAPPVKYIIEFDRMGNNDCVFYQCGNKDFVKYVETFGFKKNYGTCSDIAIIGSSWDIASVNLSCGFYHEHRPEEYVIWGDLLRTIRRADKMLRSIKNAPFFDHKEVQTSYYNYLNKGYSYGSYGKSYGGYGGYGSGYLSGSGYRSGSGYSAYDNECDVYPTYNGGYSKIRTVGKNNNLRGSLLEDDDEIE